jgi:sarcosine oxidase delta subunit
MTSERMIEDFAEYLFLRDNPDRHWPANWGNSCNTATATMTASCRPGSTPHGKPTGDTAAIA